MEDSVVTSDREQSLFDALDKGIDDMENGHVTEHDTAMVKLLQRYEEHVLQNP